MKLTVTILTIIISLFTIILILMQGKGSGLGSAWGGSGETFQTRRGIEKWLLYATIFIICSFFTISLVSLLI